MNKENELKNYLRDLKRVAVAYSSGVDSTYLLKIAHEVLGNNAIAITASSKFFPQLELKEATSFCRLENIKQIIFFVDLNDINEFKSNPIDRCYHCKKYLFTKIKEIATKNQIENVIEGSNMDDLKDYRPGLKALSELQIKSPFREVNMFKSEIRELSKKINLLTWNKSSFACLASRFVYGDEITEEKLSMIECSEELLRSKGFEQYRVRIHQDIARIEILPEEFDKLLMIREEVVESLKAFGFKYVTMDLLGYRTGSMNLI